MRTKTVCPLPPRSGVAMVTQKVGEDEGLEVEGEGASSRALHLKETDPPKSICIVIVWQADF